MEANDYSPFKHLFLYPFELLVSNITDPAIAVTTSIPSKEERVHLVRKAYFVDKKTCREIAHKFRISPRDIGKIINETAEPNQKQQPISNKSTTSQAFQLFLDNKSLVNVTIELDILPHEVEKIYTDFLRL